MNRVRIIILLTAALLGLVAVAAPEPAAAGNREVPSEPTPPRSMTADDIRRAARELDRLVALDLVRNGMKPNPMTDDATFVRRVYLDVIGRIPTEAEARSFLESKSQTKRRDLIDELLDSPGYVSHMFNYWSDLFRVKTRLNQALSGEAYIHWLKKSVAENMPYDQMARELVTASGAAYENGATGYHLRDRGMPEDNMANTVRLFLGTRIECAQCHDHPFDKWTQKQFFEMAAFTGGMNYRTDFQRSESGRTIARAARSLRDSNRNGYRIVRQVILRALSQGISGSGAGITMLPDDYQYDDAEPNALITAKTLFGEDADLQVEKPRIPRRLMRRAQNPERARRFLMSRLPQIDTRGAFADWLTAPENPRFTTVIANRMWKRVMGLGLIEPVDSMIDDTVPVNPDLMEHLEKVMVDGGYDLKAFLRVLLNSGTYQREATSRDLLENEVYRFNGPLMRRMSAEQMWDSLLTLTRPDVDGTVEIMSARAKSLYDNYDRLVSLSPDELADQVDAIAQAEDPRRAFRRMSYDNRREQLAQARPLYRSLRRAQRRGDEEEVARITAELKQLGVDPSRRRRRRGNSDDTVRASEVSSPAPAGHFLRQLGQSDKEQIDAAHTDANVPQILTFLNGHVDRMILGNDRAPVIRGARDARNADAAVESVYLSVLGRKPDAEEKAMWRKDVRTGDEQGLGDLVWTLTNSHEFRFVR